MNVECCGQLLDGNAAILQDALLAVDESDRRLGRARVAVAVVERDVAGLGPQLADVDRVLVLPSPRRPAVRIPCRPESVWRSWRISLRRLSYGHAPEARLVESTVPVRKMRRACIFGSFNRDPAGRRVAGASLAASRVRLLLCSFFGSRKQDAQLGIPPRRCLRPHLVEALSPRHTMSIASP